MIIKKINFISILVAIKFWLLSFNRSYTFREKPSFVCRIDIISSINYFVFIVIKTELSVTIQS